MLMKMFSSQNTSVVKEEPGVETRTPGWITLVSDRGSAKVLKGTTLTIKFNTKSTADSVNARIADNGVVSWDLTNLLEDTNTKFIEYITFSDNSDKTHNLKCQIDNVNLLSMNLIYNSGLDLLLQDGNIYNMDMLTYTTNAYSFGFIATSNYVQPNLPIWDTVNPSDYSYDFVLPNQSIFSTDSLMSISNGEDWFPGKGDYTWEGLLLNASPTGGNIEMGPGKPIMAFKFTSQAGGLGFKYRNLTQVSTGNQCYLVIDFNKLSSADSSPVYVCIICRYTIQFN